MISESRRRPASCGGTTACSALRILPARPPTHGNHRARPVSARSKKTGKQRDKRRHERHLVALTTKR
jgi:hypothetical protein